MKKFISLFLVFSILALSGNLFAKERRGDELIIQKTDGTQVRGELIAVKQTSLLLLEQDSGADVTVDIGDIGIIKTVKKSKLWIGAGYEFLIGIVIGAIVGVTLFDDPTSREITAEGWAAIGALVGGGVGLLIGGIIGAASRKDKTIQIEGKSDSEIQEILEELRKKARVKNFQ